MLTCQIFGMTEAEATIFIPTFASIIVFILGYVFNSFLKCRHEAEVRRRHRESVIEWIKIIKIPLKEDINLIKDFSKECLNNTWLQQPQLNWRPLLGNKFERIIDNSILEGFYHENHMYERVVFNLVSQSSFLSLIEQEIRSRYEEYGVLSKNLMERWNNTYVDLTNRIYDMINNQLPLNSNLRGFLINTMNQHNGQMAMNPNNFIVSYDTMITSIANSVYFHNPEMQWFNQVYGNTQLLKREWETLQEGYSVVFGQVADRLENSLSILEEILIQIESTSTN